MSILSEILEQGEAILKSVRKFLSVDRFENEITVIRKAEQHLASGSVYNNLYLPVEDIIKELLNNNEALLVDFSAKGILRGTNKTIHVDRAYTIAQDGFFV